MEGTAQPSGALDDRLAALGRMSLIAPCFVGGHAARVMMNATDVLLITDRSNDPVQSAPFASVRVWGDGARRTISIAGQQTEVRFASNDWAQTFDRSLRDRQRATPARTSDGRVLSRPAVPVQAFETRLSEPATGATQYARYARAAMTASGFLLVFGWLDLIFGVIFTLVLWAHGAGLIGFLWLYVAAASCALPLCVGYLTRAVIARHRVIDEGAWR